MARSGVHPPVDERDRPTRTIVVGVIVAGLFALALVFGRAAQAKYAACWYDDDDNAGVFVLLTLVSALCQVVPIALSFEWNSPWWIKLIAILALPASLLGGLGLALSEQCAS